MSHSRNARERARPRGLAALAALAVAAVLAAMPAIADPGPTAAPPVRPAKVAAQPANHVPDVDLDAMLQRRHVRTARFYAANVARDRLALQTLGYLDARADAERAAAAAQDARERLATATTTTTPAVHETPIAAPQHGSGACGGDLPPCSVMMCESGGNLTAQNPNSTASGKWQILDSTWAGFMGYSRAMYAPEWVQDERARQIYAGGAGRSAWVC